MKKLSMIPQILTVTLLLTACSKNPVRQDSNTSLSHQTAKQLSATSSEHLTGDAAVAFINKYFPHAEIPGPVTGPIIDKDGQNLGDANCNYPAMGARSEGEVPTCDINWLTKV